VSQDVKLYIIFQSQELLPVLEPLINNFGNQIFLVGKVDHDDLEYWYNAVDFIVSSSHYEAGGTAVCEAMACGCVPILSNISSFRRMTANGNCGLLFEPGSTSRLLKALLKSKDLELDKEKEKVLHQFNTTLSNQAIALQIHSVLSSA
jgi:glycosyltransferase involved in cell wall biosynthesis